MHDVAVLIGQHLHFDVPRVLDVFFEIDVAIAERRFGLGPRLLQRRLERQIVRRHAHAAPAAAGHRFDQHRKADLVRKAHRFFVVANEPVAARHHRHARSVRAKSRAAFLSPSWAIASGVGPMKSILQLRQISLK